MYKKLTQILYNDFPNKSITSFHYRAHSAKIIHMMIQKGAKKEMGTLKKKMSTLEERIAKLEYYHSLLLQMIDREKKPFYYLIMQAGLTKEEVDETLKLCETLSEEYEKQKAEGLIVFTPLLTHFAGMLHPKLPLEQTIDALLKQQMFVPLMTEFQQLLQKLDEL
jgi:hypothetical protein